MKKPQKKSVEFIDYFDAATYIEKKYNIDLDNYGPLKQSFWHWLTDSGDISNGKIKYFPIGYWGWEDDDTPAHPGPDNPEDVWLWEIISMFWAEFKDYADDGEIRVRYEW